jgi:dCTP deaminase
MFVNGKSLLKAAPIENMFETKMRFEGTSYGLAEAGYDIRIKQRILYVNDAYGERITVSDEDGDETFAGNFVLASAMERFQMPNNLVGNVKDKSTWARRGLSVFNTVIEPGWNGFLTLELVFHGSETIEIHPGQGIAQVLFGRLEESGDYGDGKYQNAADKPQVALA